MSASSNSFEFLGKVNFGQYLPLNSPLHLADARARILAFFFLVAGLTFAPRPAGLLIGLGVLAGALAWARIPWRFPLRAVLGPLPFLGVLAFLQVIFNPRLDLGPAWFILGPIAVTPAGLLAGGMLLLRFSGLVLGFSLASYCLSTSELVRGLQYLLSPLEKVGLPARDLVMAIQVMLRFIPLLAVSAERIARAQAARGGEWGSGQGSLIARARQVIPLLVPLFVTALHKAEALALAMDSRGYNNPVAHPTALVEMHFRQTDAFLAAGSFLMFWILILV